MSRRSIDDLLTVSSEQWGEVLAVVQYRKTFVSTLKNTVYTLITVAAVAVLVAVLLLPVLRIYGTSMSPTLEWASYPFSRGSSQPRSQTGPSGIAGRSFTN